MGELALKRSISDAIAEYDMKKSQVSEAVSAFEAAGVALRSAATINGVWGQERIDTGHIHQKTIERALLKSAWFSLYDGLNLKILMSAKDKKMFDQSMADPAPFTKENIRATFGNYIIDPWGNVLRGLAEVFCELDQSYKSHDKVKIGVDGLPKRIIMSGFGGYSGYGLDRLINVLNALASYQGKPLVDYSAMYKIVEVAKKVGMADIRFTREDGTIDDRGATLKIFKNGNAHLFFDAPTLKDINRALAQYYGEVLPDCNEEKPEKRAESTAVSKDLQYYPTPEDVVVRMMRDIYIRPGDSVLEPSCGCGRILDAARAAGAVCYGVEVDSSRAAQARAKGHPVHTANFLETVPKAEFDYVIMNPPFYGRHYAKHVLHAIKFLKPGGTLTAILPATARYDHGLLDGRWSDLPVGSFRESGTNINTTVLTIRKNK